MSEVTPEAPVESGWDKLKEDVEDVFEDAKDEAEKLGWTLAHEAEDLVRYIKRIPYQDALLEASGPDKETALENVKATEAAQEAAKATEEPASPEAPAEETPTEEAPSAA